MMTQHHTGFSLIELIITMSIITILTATGYPAYTHHLATAARQEAQTALLHAAQKMQIHYAQTHSYEKTSLASLGLESTESERYTYQLTIHNAHSYQLEAIPKKTQAIADSTCGLLSINELGEQKADGTYNPDCW